MSDSVDEKRKYLVSSTLCTRARQLLKLERQEGIGVLLKPHLATAFAICDVIRHGHIALPSLLFVSCLPFSTFVGGGEHSNIMPALRYLI
jgi:hypothetical protein